MIYQIMLIEIMAAADIHSVFNIKKFVALISMHLSSEISVRCV